MKIDISFKSIAPITNRTIQVAEAFGLGIDDEKIFNIYNNLELNIKVGDIVYITGDSGSGKSLLLKYIEKSYLNSINISSIEINPEEVLIDNIGNSIEEAIKFLSLVGLNDAYLFLRRYKELSDGQKYRYKIAKLLNSGKKEWFLDEFVSLLDRDMAKIVAFNIQKIARKFGITLFIATAHQDLIDDLCPTILIKKGFENEVEMNYLNNINNHCSICSNLVIKRTTKKDIESLLKFHYKNTKVSFTKHIFGLYLKNNLIGCIVYSCPKIKLHGRSLVYKKQFELDKGYPNLPKINSNIILISRVVIHPKYRSIGLGVHIVRETLKAVNMPIVETIATMSKYNPFFEKAGMTLVKEQDNTTKQKAFNKIKNYLLELNFSLPMTNSRNYNLNKLNELSKDNLLKLKEIFYNNRRLFAFQGSRKDNFMNFDNTKFAEYITKAIPKTMYYLYWENDELSSR